MDSESFHCLEFSTAAIHDQPAIGPPNGEISFYPRGSPCGYYRHQPAAGPVAPGGASGQGSRETHFVCQQLAPDRHSDAELRQSLQELPAGMGQ